MIKRNWILHNNDLFVPTTKFILRMTNAKNRGMVGFTRWVEVEFKTGCYMNNFCWLEGPLPGDTELLFCTADRSNSAAIA